MRDFIYSVLTEAHAFWGFLMAAVLAVLRIYFDKSETAKVRIALESLICGFLTLAIGSGLIALGYGPEVFLFVAGVTGFFGTQWIRKSSQAFFNKVIGNELDR